MKWLMALALSCAFCADVANAKVDDVPTLLACTFGMPGSKLDLDGETHHLYVLQKTDGRGREIISQIDDDSLLGTTVLAYRKTTKVDGGELWTFAESDAAPTGVMLMVLPKVFIVDGVGETRSAALGQYHGSNPRNGVCLIDRGEDAVRNFAAMSSKEPAK